MSQIASSFERFVPLLEQYLFSDNQDNYKRQLKDATDRKLIEVLTCPFTNIDDLRDSINQLGLPSSFREKLIQSKLFKIISQEKNLQNSEALKIIKEKYCSEKFEYSQPPASKTAVSKEKQMNALPTELKLENDLSKILVNRIGKDAKLFRKLNDYGFSKMPEEFLLKLGWQDKEHFLNTCGALFSFSQKFIAKFISEYEKERLKTDKLFKISSKILSSLSKSQVLHLGTEMPDFFKNEDYIEIWFNHSYAEELGEYTTPVDEMSQSRKQQKRKALLNIIQQLTKKDNYFLKEYINSLKRQILVIDISLSDTSAERLNQYISTLRVFPIHLFTEEGIDKSMKQSKNSYEESSYVPKLRFTLESDKLTIDKLIEEYLSNLFKNSQNNDDIINIFKSKIKDSWLKKLNAKVQLAKGEQVLGIHNYLSVSELQALKQRKQITILPENAKRFKVNDDVRLKITFKNIKQVEIKVYELDLAKHLINTHMNVEENVQLSFLIPNSIEVYQVNSKNSYHVITEDVLLSKIEKKMGMYIVDLQGEGISSRAIIKKGAIICLDSPSEAGMQIKFYDEDGQKLTQKDGLKLYVQDKEETQFYSPNSFIIPYAEKKQYIHIVASFGSYAELYSKFIDSEDFKIEVGYLYNTESFLVGKKAQITIHSRLKMNGNLMSLSLLEKIRIKVTLNSNQDIKTFHSYDNIKFNNFKDYLLEFPIQSYTKNISIQIEADVKLMTNKYITLTHSKEINIDLGQNNSNYLDFYLERIGKEYVLNLKGLNGESISHTDVNVGYSIVGIDDFDKVQLRTNENGKICLGNLSVTKKITAEINSNEVFIQRVWQINNQEYEISYSNEVYIKQGQLLKFPISEEWKSQDILLLSTFDKFFVENLTSKLQIHNGWLTLPKDLKKGTVYHLKFLPLDKTIYIEVLENIKWQDQEQKTTKIYDEVESRVFQIKKNQFQNIVIRDIKTERCQNTTKATIALDLSSAPEDSKQIRVHIFANNYLDSEVSDTFRFESFTCEDKYKEHYLNPRKCAYFSNKIQSDEGAYVYNRRGKDIIGNNLQKPRIFLKRIEVRETEQKEEQLDHQGGYIEECAVYQLDRNRKEKLIQKRKKEAKTITNGRSTLGINSHNNFLLYSGNLFNNLNGNTLTVNVPQAYNNLTVVVLTPQSAIKKNFSLHSHSLKKQFKNLRHIGMNQLNDITGWTMERQIYKIQAKQTKQVSRDCQWRVISLADIFSYAGTKRIKLFDWSKDLLRWKGLEEKKKRQIYNKQCCHELNVFLKYQDSDFFQQIVVPFIKNKIVKTFVDLCLLEDPSVVDYTQLHKLNKLNDFEKVLLIIQLKKNQKEDQAKNIAESMQLIQKSYKKSFEEYKRCFDTLINAKESLDAKKPQRMVAGDTRYMDTRADQGFTMECAMSFDRGMRRNASQDQDQDDERGEESFRRARGQKMMEKKAFVPVQKTKEYTQRTYYEVKNYNTEARNLIPSSSFWSELAQHILQNKEGSPFISDAFMYFSNGVEFILASSFLSYETSDLYDLNNINENYQIISKNPFLLYVKEVKSVQYKNKFGILINQRVFDPKNKYIYEEDGTQVQREVTEFIVKRPYKIQTVVTNTSGTALELQVLTDIPKGAIPLRNHQYTQISSTNINSFSTVTFERQFYFPETGKYQLYAANACRGKSIIGKANPLPEIEVKEYEVVNSLQTFSDILRSGNQADVLSYIKEKNIFDDKLFDYQLILWMLKDNQFYSQAIKIFRHRRFYQKRIWLFGFLHNDYETIKEYLEITHQNAVNQFQLPIFQYFPYYSSRTHKFANENKSTIRNVQFKETYYQFLVNSIINNKHSSDFELTLIYYLILQDRLEEAQKMVCNISANARVNHKIQLDYIECFLDMSLASPTFSRAREIIKEYANYPVEAWKKLFDDVKNTLDADDEADFKEELTNVEYQTAVIKEGTQIRINIPEKTRVQVSLYEVNLEMYFSECPFYQIRSFTSVLASHLIVFDAGASRQEKIIRSDLNKFKDFQIQIREIKPNLPMNTVDYFFWNNPEVKVNIKETEGTLQVFVEKKKRPGCYVKVYSDGKGHNKFYRDGYTDINGTFRYALADLDDIKQFSILVVTEKGSVMNKVKPPSKAGSLKQ